MVFTWLQNSTQKHNRLIFGFLLVVVGVSFVFYTGSGSQAGGLSGPNARYLDVDLSDRRATERYADALLLSGIPPSSESHTYQLCLSIARKHLADQLEIPTPNDTSVQTRVRSFFARNGADGPTAQEWEAFVSRLQAELGCGRDEALARLQRVVEDNLRWEKAARLLGGPGHASPQEVRKALEVMDTRWTVEVARLPFTQFQPVIAEDLNKAQATFNAQAERYRLPGRVTVRVLTFPTPAPQSRTVADEEILAHAYNFAEELGIKPDNVSEQAMRRKTEITQRILARSSIEEEAARLSDDLLDRFPDVDRRPSDEALDRWLKDTQAKAQVLPDFAVGDEPNLKGVPAAALRAASAFVEATGWHTEFYPSAAGPLVIIVDKRTPSRLPSFEEVKVQALANWRESERSLAFLRKSQEISVSLAKSVAAGETYGNAAKALGLVLEGTLNFVAAEPPATLAGPGVRAETALAEAGKGKVTEPIPLTGGDFAFLYASEQQVPTIEITDVRFKNILTAVTQQQARTTLNGNPGIRLPNGEVVGAAGMGLLDELTTAPGAPATLER